MLTLGQVSAQMRQILEWRARWQAPSQEDLEQSDALAALEDHLDWLEIDRQRPGAAQEDGAWQEPDWDRR